MKILLTGASGFIGTNFILRFYKNYEIVALVRDSSNTQLLESKCKIYRYKSCEDLANYLRTEAFDGVLHLATMYYKKSERYKGLQSLIDSNITFGVEILEALARIDFRGFFINIGTFWQFYKNVPSNPLDLYATSKGAFEHFIRFYQGISNISFSTLYINDTYGLHENRNKIINLWFKIAKSGERLEMSGGEQLIDMLYIDDVLDALEILSNLLSLNVDFVKNRAFTLHSKERKTLRELAAIFEEATNTKLNIIWGSKPYVSRENFIPFEGGEKLPLWEQKVSFKEGIMKILKMGGGCRLNSITESPLDSRASILLAREVA